MKFPENVHKVIDDLGHYHVALMTITCSQRYSDDELHTTPLYIHTPAVPCPSWGDPLIECNYVNLLMPALLFNLGGIISVSVLVGRLALLRERRACVPRGG